MNRFLPLAICVVAFAIITSAADAPTLSRSDASTLVIISPHGEDVKTEFAAAFAKWHAKKYGQPVKIDWRDLGGTNDDIRFVLSEFKTKPDGIGIDIFFGGGDYPFVELAQKKLAASYRPPPEILDQLPRDIGGVPMYDDKDFTWYGFATAGFGIAYNKKVLKAKGWPEPKTWRDLTNPGIQGWIASGDPRNSGSTHNMYELILQAYGWEEGWAVIYQMGANAREFHKSSANAVKDCTLGNTAYALAIDFYAYTQIEFIGKENFGWVLPPEIAVLNPDGIAILKGAPHREVAEHFLNFCLGEEGQKLIFLPRGHPDGPQRFNIARMSLRRDFYDRYKEISPVVGNPFLMKTVRYDAAKGIARQKVVDALIGATVIDTHEEAVAALTRADEISRKSRAVGIYRLLAGLIIKPPLTEVEATDMAKTKWGDLGFRNSQIIEWQKWAQKQYQTYYP